MTKILAALVGALLLANGVGLATIDDDADVAHPTTSTTTPRSTTSTSTGPTTPTTVPDELATLVHQLQAFVEAHRGLRFKAPLKFSLLSDAAFRRHVLKMAQEDDAELIRTADELRALGLIKSSDDLKAGRDELLGSAIVGLYDPETKELQVRGTRLTPYVRSTLAHEITMRCRIRTSTSTIPTTTSAKTRFRSGSPPLLRATRSASKASTSSR